ncbi:MAG TPA: serine hydrolase domain-containing protein, partial [Blastocatellia bacterium]|nr:serine hydrolase domain-containing protein [Blastocatellia bacterium]
MRKRFLEIRIQTFVIAIAWLLAAQTSVRAQDKAAKIDELMKVYNSYRQFNGAVLVAENGKVIFKKGYGMANMEWNIPVETDTKFRLGSITKQFTSMLILQLVQEGKIKLEGKLTDYLPDYRKDTGDRITIHQLLNHTSGIPSYTGLPNFFQEISRNPYSVSDFVKKYTSGDLEFEPGTKWNYNNSGYFLLGAIVESVTGKPYEQALKERIFDPVGMKNTGYDHYATILAKRAAGYEKRPGGFINAPYLDMSLPYAAGSLYSTVEDLYLWDQAL